MIDIIIPVFNAHKTIRKTLLSIMLQVNIDDINVYLIDDASKKGYEEEYNLFKDKINLIIYRLDKNMGPGYARQYGIEKSDSDFILFMDSDDLLHDIFSVKRLYDAALDTQSDVIVGDMVEIYDDEILKYTVGFDVLHAKMYKREFLEKNNISFPNMYNSEDLSFNNLVLMSKPKIEYIDDFVYVYIRQNNSLTMSKDYYSKKHIKYYTENLIWTIKKAEENNYNHKEIAKIVCFSFAYLYYYFYNNLDDVQMIYVYNIISLYQKYEKFLSTEEKIESVDFWLERFDETPIDLSFNEFISLCEKKNIEN